MEESLDWLWREGNDCVPLFSRAIRNVSSYLIYLYVDLVRHIHKLKISICHRILRKEEGTRLWLAATLLFMHQSHTVDPGPKSSEPIFFIVQLTKSEFWRCVQLSKSRVYINMYSGITMFAWSQTMTGLWKGRLYSLHTVGGLRDWGRKERNVTDDVSLWLRNTIGTDLSRLQSIGHLNKWSLPGSSDGEESTHNVGYPGSIPREGNGYSLQYSCLENPMDIGAWWAAVCGAAKSQTSLSN